MSQPQAEPVTNHIPTTYRLEPYTEHRPTVYRQQTDHVTTTHRPYTDQIPTPLPTLPTTLPTTYLPWRPHTDPVTDHTPSTYRRHTDHTPTPIPTTYRPVQKVHYYYPEHRPVRVPFKMSKAHAYSHTHFSRINRDTLKVSCSLDSGVALMQISVHIMQKSLAVRKTMEAMRTVYA